MAKVAIVMGSTSDWPTMQQAAKMLKSFGVEFEAKVVSAHRTPNLLVEFAESAADEGDLVHYEEDDGTPALFKAPAGVALEFLLPGARA